MKIVDTAVLDGLTLEAKLLPRLRKNHNLHAGDASSCHRLFNAIEPGSYIRPHRHLDPQKDETFVLIRGVLGIVLFDEAGGMTERVLLSAANGTVAADIPHGVFHGALALESGTVFFEAKAGPYLPLSAEEKGAFAPEEGSAEAAGYLERLRGLFV